MIYKNLTETMKDSTLTTGKKGEDEACSKLIQLGHRIVERNWRSGHLEIDIISLDRNGLHFVEVKSRKAPVAADPQDNVGYRKQKRIEAAALSYLHKRKGMADCEVFFDVVSVVFYQDRTEIEYYPNAYIPIYV